MEKIKSKEGIIIISILWGLGLSCLFRKVCKDRSCIIYRSPNKDELLGKIFKFGENCWKYNTKVISCPTKNEIKIDSLQVIPTSFHSNSSF